MESGSWVSLFSTSSKRHQPAIPSRSGDYLYLSFDEIEGDDDLLAEFLCPFCSEDFDIIGLCCHIEDEHPDEAAHGLCPVCASRVGMDMVGHITTQHGHFFKMQRKKMYHKGSHSPLSLLRKELNDEHLQSFFEGSFGDVSSNTDPDPLLSSFIYNLSTDIASGVTPPCSTTNEDSVKKISEEKLVERSEPSLSLPDKDVEEKFKRSQFTQELLLSTIFNDIL